MTSKFHPPDSFDFANPTAWPQWKQRYQRYAQVAKMDKEEKAVQISTMIYCMGPEAEQIFSNFTFANATDKEDPKKVIEKFDQHFIPQRNIIFERARFNLRSQEPGESVEAYIRVLYNLIEHCDYKDYKEEFLRDRLVIGLLDKDTSQLLQMERELTLQKAIETCRHRELVKTQNVQAEASSSADVVDKGNKGKYFKEKRSDKKCNRCGYNTNRAHASGKCPAQGERCRLCNKVGHFKNCCFSAKNETTTESVQNEGSLSLGAASTSNDQPWYEVLKVNNMLLKFKLDSGADVSVISEKEYKQMKYKPKLKTASITLNGVGGKIDICGYFDAKIEQSDRSHNEKIYVVRHHTVNLLSRSACVELSLIKRLENVSVFQGLGLMNCDPLKIVLKDNVTPYNLTTPRRVSEPLKPKVEAEIKRMVQEGVIVPVDKETDWCSPLVPVMKPNGNVRLCVDFKKLNKAIKRPRFILPTPDGIYSKLKGSKIFTTLDATSGYWQMPLDKDSSELTTFITDSGRYRFTRLPFGISLASEVYQREMSKILRDLSGCEVYQDDIVVHAKSMEEHDSRLNAILERIEKAGIKLNKEKCKFRQSSVTFLGHVIDENGVHASPDKVKAVVDMAPPKNTTELKSFMGMVNFMSKYVSNLSSIMSPLSALLKKTNAWIWDRAQQQAFDDVKKAIASTGTLTFYDESLPTAVSSDASSYGIGGTLLQESNGIYKPVAYVSRTMTDAEKRYSQIEKELLAIVWTCEKFSRYLIGMDTFRIITDHKPLIPIINDKDLDVIPVRCTRLMMRLMRFTGVAEHVPGKTLVIADLLSRKPLADTQSDTEEDVKHFASSIVNAIPASTPKLQQIRALTQKDKVLSSTMTYVIKGWPSIQEVPPEVREMYSVRNNLTVIDKLLFYHNRVVIPQALRLEVLMKLHAGHMGITKTISRAQQCIWYPGITVDIRKMISQCTHCQVHTNIQRAEPLITRTLPDRPWQRIDIDLMTHERNEYMVVSDEYSRWLEIVKMNRTTSTAVIIELKRIFARWGFPDVIMCDNGTQFVSTEFKSFAKECDFIIETSSPRYAQSNGGAENAVKEAKKIVSQKDPTSALMAYRATPTTTTGYSPSELLQGRRLKTFIPVVPQNLVPQLPDSENLQKMHHKAKLDQKKYFDRRHGVRDLSELQPGDRVRIRNPTDKTWGPDVRVVKKCGIRSYIVDTGSGYVRRNRRQLQLIPSMDMLPPPSEPITRNINVQQPPQAQQQQQPVRRNPPRARRPPPHLQDYEVYR